MNVVQRLTSCLELSIVLIEVSANVIDVDILLECIFCELVNVCSKCSNDNLAIEGGKYHYSFVHERREDLEFSIDGDFIILAIGKQRGLVLFSEAVVQRVSHLFVVL